MEQSESIFNLLNNKDSAITQQCSTEFGLCVCVYIISMKKGQVISIRRTLPPECPFQTYAELQNHWNSMVCKNTCSLKNIDHNMVLMNKQKMYFRIIPPIS